jgi:hypothetical protein
MLYVRFIATGGGSLTWCGVDPEKGRVTYSYSVDGGIWSRPSSRVRIAVSDLQAQLHLSKGRHSISVKAIDPQGAESLPMTSAFVVSGKPGK